MRIRRDCDPRSSEAKLHYKLTKVGVAKRKVVGAERQRKVGGAAAPPTV